MVKWKLRGEKVKGQVVFQKEEGDKKAFYQVPHFILKEPLEYVLKACPVLLGCLDIIWRSFQEILKHALIRNTNKTKMEKYAGDFFACNAEAAHPKMRWAATFPFYSRRKIFLYFQKDTEHLDEIIPRARFK